MGRMCDDTFKWDVLIVRVIDSRVNDYIVITIGKIDKKVVAARVMDCKVSETGLIVS